MMGLKFYVILFDPDRERNRTLRSRIRDNMKMFRAYGCEVTIWIDGTAEDCSRIQANENLPCHVSPLDRYPAELRPTEDGEEALLLLQDDKILFRQIRRDNKQLFDLAELVGRIVALN